MAETLTAEQRERRHRAFLESWGAQLAEDARHPRSLWTHEHQLALEAMQAWHPPLHARIYPASVVGPPPWHTLTPAADSAREAMLEAGRRRWRAPDLPIETHTPAPWREVPIASLIGAPAEFAAKALAAGHEVKAVAAPPAVMVVVRSPRIRATWVEGRSSGAEFDGRARGVTIAEYRLTMTLADAEARAAKEAEVRAEKAAATRAAKALESGA